LSDDLNERLKGHATVKIKKLKTESFPLQKRIAKNIYNKRSILMGDAAHVIHPMAGQGLNLGLRDLRELEILLKKRKSNNLGIESFLAKYNRHRKRDVFELMYLTDSLYEFFPGSLGVNRTWMNKALQMFEKSDAVTTFFMDRAIQ
jgi:2-polyprenyl-6-methoxyphenol hydroxylase-like FAD-dependent oxidoreductase